MSIHSLDYFAPDAFEVQVSEMLVATSDGSDALLDASVSEVLRLVKDQLKMDVVFVSEFADGRNVFRRVETRPGAEVVEVGASRALEESFCQRVIDGRMPRLVHDVAALPNKDELPPTAFPVGAHMSTPIVLADGRIYGTFCCFSFSANDALTERDLKKLEMCAQLTARKIDAQRAAEVERASEAWRLQQQGDRGRS
ncbi:MAG: GAF domain-containing protein [Variovorax sp.]